MAGCVLFMPHLSDLVLLLQLSELSGERCSALKGSCDSFEPTWTTQGALPRQCPLRICKIPFATQRNVFLGSQD